MTVKRVYKKALRTPRQLAKLRATRDNYQKEKPSLKQALSASGYERPMPLGELIQLHELLGEIKKQRERLGLTLSELAKRTGIDVATLSKLESGKHDNPTIGTIFRVSSTLGKRVRCILEDTVPPKWSGKT
jgi:DNA-binding XRE family transcriptional regulator